MRFYTSVSNIDPQLRRELEAWQERKRRAAFRKARERKRYYDNLSEEDRLILPIRWR